VSSRKNLSIASAARKPRTLRISEVARRVGISSSALRAWEALGLVSPQRTESRYRLFTESDVRLLQRAIFLRRPRLIPPPSFTCSSARELSPPLRKARSSPVSASAAADPPRTLARSSGSRHRRLRRFLSALERGQMRSSIATLRRIARFYRTNILSLFETAGDNPRLVRPNQRKVLETTPDVRMELLAWGNTVMEPHLFRIKPAAAAVNPTRMKARNSCMSFAEF